MPIAYTASIGSLSFTNSGGGQQTRVLEIDCEAGIGGASGCCRLDLGDPGRASPSLGDAVSVEFDAGNGAHKVFTGEVDSIERAVTSVRVRAQDSMAKLARTEVQGVYEEVSAGFIVNDLLSQAGATAGQVEDGPTFPSYVVHRGPRALRHIQALEQLIGAETSCDGEGKVHFRRPQSPGSPSYRLVWGEDLLRINLQVLRAQTDSFVIWGEGAAGSDGADRGHWLPTDLSGVTGDAQIQPGSNGQPGTVSAGSGALLRTIRNGAVRSAQVASELAQARAKRLAFRPVFGHAVCLGRPDAQPGEWIDLADLPTANNSSTTLSLRVLRIIHRFTTELGLLTRLEF